VFFFSPGSPECETNTKKRVIDKILDHDLHHECQCQLQLLPHRLHELLTEGAAVHIIICSKFQSKEYTKDCFPSFFCCIFRSNRKTQSWYWLALRKTRVHQFPQASSGRHKLWEWKNLAWGVSEFWGIRLPKLPLTENISVQVERVGHLHWLNCSAPYKGWRHTKVNCHLPGSIDWLIRCRTLTSVKWWRLQYISHQMSSTTFVVQQTQQTIGSVGLSYSTLSEQESKQVPPIHFQTILKSTH
jgi:hypothetical protein